MHVCCRRREVGQGSDLQGCSACSVQYAILGLERGERAPSNVRHWMGASECNGVLCSRIPPPSTSHPHRPPSPAHTHVGCSKLWRRESGKPGMPGMPARPCQSALGRPRARCPPLPRAPAAAVATPAGAAAAAVALGMPPMQVGRTSPVLPSCFWQGSSADGECCCACWACGRV